MPGPFFSRYLATGDASLVDHSLLQLEERKAQSVTALRKELGIEKARSAAKPDVVRASGNAFSALLPRDLTWDLYAKVLSAEEVP